MTSDGVTLPDYRVLGRDERSCRLELSIDRGLPYFEGHFSGTPVLPGVVQLGWAIALAQQCLNVSGDVTRLEGVKFHRVIVPAAVVTLELRELSPGPRIAFTYSAGAQVHSSGRVGFVPAS